MNKAKEFWERFGIKGENFIKIMKILTKPEYKELTKQKKINIIKKMYQEKTNKYKKILDNEQKKLNNIKFKLKVENNRLVKRKSEEKFFKSEDNIQNYEEIVQPIKNNIIKYSKIFNEYNIILTKLTQYTTEKK